MKKGKSIVLLTIISVVLAVLLAMSFVKFPTGVYDFKSFLGAVSLDYDLAGGTAYTLTLAEDNEEEVENIDAVMATLKARLEELGYDNSKITATKKIDTAVEDYSIRIETRTTNSLSSDIKAVTAYGTVKFFGGTASDPTTEIMNEKKAIADARYVGQGYSDSGSQTYNVQVSFTDYGYSALLKEIQNASSSAGQGSSSEYYLKISLAGQTLLNSNISESTIANKSVVISSSTEEGAKSLALQIRTGGLAYKYDVSDGVSVSAMLGDNTAIYALIAIAVVVLAAIVVISVFYKGFGVIAGLTMISFVLFELVMLISVPGIMVNFGGIVGIILATVFAADGLVIISKRIQEEYSKGKTIKASIKTGYRRAFMPILNSNVVVGVICLALFIFTKGALQNLAITLGIGIVVSFISTILLSALFTNVIVPLVPNSDKFFNLKRVDK